MCYRASWPFTRLTNIWKLRNDKQFGVLAIYDHRADNSRWLVTGEQENELKQSTIDDGRERYLQYTRLCRIWLGGCPFRIRTEFSRWMGHRRKFVHLLPGQMCDRLMRRLERSWANRGTVHTRDITIGFLCIKRCDGGCDRALHRSRLAGVRSTSGAILAGVRCPRAKR